VPEGHTLHRLATELTAAFAGHPVRVSSPQGRFGAEAMQLDGSTLLVAESAGKHLFLDFRRRPRGARASRVDRRFRRAPWSHRGARADRPGADAADRGRRAHVVRRPARGHAVCAGHRDPPRRDRREARPRPAAGRRRPEPVLGAHLEEPASHRRPADGPGRARRGRQRLPRRGAVPTSHPPPATGPHAPRRAVAGDVGRPRGADGRGCANRSDRHRATRAHARGDGPSATRRRPRRRGLRVSPYRPAVPGLRQHRPHRCARGTQHLLVPALSAHVPLRALQ
jgi:hypothetical protein